MGIKKGEWCSGSGHVINPDVGVPTNRISEWNASMGERPVGEKRPYHRCPVCNRRLRVSVSVCHDGCCVIHRVPHHKVKGKKRKAGRNH